MHSFVAEKFMMKSMFLFFFLCLMPILVICFPSCSFREDIPALQYSDNLACYSSILICRAGLSSSSPSIRSLDIFIYDTCGNGPLDSYEHFDFIADGGAASFPEVIDVCSSSGEKQVVLIANLQSSDLSYRDIESYRKISMLSSSIYNEDGNFPIMVGECRMKAGPGKIHSIELSPLFARITIRSFNVDFSKRSYSGKALEEIKAYLVNANAAFGFLQKEPSVTTDFINFRGLDMACTASMKTPWLLVHEGEDVQGCKLFCYPCVQSTQNGGNPTMLVIEGKIDGATYYYPIIIGDGSIESGTDYVFDIMITRSGATSPDEPLNVEDMCVEFEIEKWKEYDWEMENY